MMLEKYNELMNMRGILLPPVPPSLRTGVGHGHSRSFYREKPEKDAYAKKHKRAKMSKASRKRNRR